MYSHIIGPSLDLLVQAMLVLVPEWRIANQQDIQDDPWEEVTCFDIQDDLNEYLTSRVKFKG